MGPGFLSRWALPVSLALNVFLGTVLFMLHDGPPPRPPGGGPPSPLHFIERLAADLPPADGALLREMIARRAGEIEYRHRIWSGLPERVRTHLAAPVLDVEGLRAVLGEGRDAHRAMDDSLAELIVEAAAAMSPEGRQAIVRWRPPPPPGGRPPPPR